MPELVYQPKNEPEQMYSVYYDRITSVLVNGLKELNNKVEQQQKQINQQQQQIQQLMKLIQEYHK